MNLPNDNKKIIRRRIKNRIKKKYIIEHLYGNNCHICNEFNTKMHMRTFDFCHQNPDNKTVNASSLYDTLSCSEIVEFLRSEHGAYICSNCHTVYDMKYFDLIDDIYDNQETAEKIKEDYHNVRRSFTPITRSMIRNVANPLKKSILITKNYEKYIIAIDDLSNQSIDATNNIISNKLGIDYSGVKSFFLRHRDFLKHYIDFFYGNPTRYTLNSLGEALVFLINYFNDYYSSLELDECKECSLNTGERCSATAPNQCPLIKEGKHLHFKIEL
ncbi:MAG: hypothetical protein ACTSRI_08705 [Promethearchaeota archaeon]